VIAFIKLEQPPNNRITILSSIRACIRNAGSD
jgi:hypothetical protein